MSPKHAVLFSCFPTFVTVFRFVQEITNVKFHQKTCKVFYKFLVLKTSFPFFDSEMISVQFFRAVLISRLHCFVFFPYILISLVKTLRIWVRVLVGGSMQHFLLLACLCLFFSWKNLWIMYTWNLLCIVYIIIVTTENKSVRQWTLERLTLTEILVIKITKDIVVLRN